MANAPTGLRLSDETHGRLDALGKARDRSPHYLMKVAVERYLETEETVEAERNLTRARWEKFALTSETVGHAEVKAWAASLGGADDAETG